MTSQPQIDDLAQQILGQRQRIENLERRALPSSPTPIEAAAGATFSCDFLIVDGSLTGQTDGNETAFSWVFHDNSGSSISIDPFDSTLIAVTDGLYLVNMSCSVTNSGVTAGETRLQIFAGGGDSFNARHTGAAQIAGGFGSFRGSHHYGGQLCAGSVIAGFATGFGATWAGSARLEIFQIAAMDVCVDCTGIG